MQRSQFLMTLKSTSDFNSKELAMN